jgi:hypothetical protein
MRDVLRRPVIIGTDGNCNSDEYNCDEFPAQYFVLGQPGTNLGKLSFDSQPAARPGYGRQSWAAVM